MKIKYDASVDALMVRIHEDSPISRTVEVAYGLVDLDTDDNIVGFELLGASAIIEKAAELASRPDLEDALTAALTKYAHEAMNKLDTKHRVS